jgi:hypothetical protein
MTRESSMLKQALVTAIACLCLGTLNTPNPCAAELDPLSVVQTLMDAQNGADADAALALFTDGAVIINLTGDKFAGDDLRRFIQTDTWVNDRFAMGSPRVRGDKVLWTRSVTAGFYRHLGIAPVQFAFEATVRAGRSCRSSPTFRYGKSRGSRRPAGLGRRSPRSTAGPAPNSYAASRRTRGTAQTLTARTRIEQRTGRDHDPEAAVFPWKETIRPTPDGDRCPPAYCSRRLP